jgi:hypothetical protein
MNFQYIINRNNFAQISLYFLFLVFPICDSFRAINNAQLQALPFLPVNFPLNTAFSNFRVSKLFATSTENTYDVNSLLSQPKNLKTAPGMLSKMNEVMGLSESELLIASTKNDDSASRTEKSLKLAYNRCEYVTKLFSKTFYMGTSLMRPDARQHVWAIYTWCRRTDDLVDSPRALLNRDTLKKDLQDWNKRLDEIWAGNSYF